MQGRNAFGIWGGVALIGLGLLFLLGQVLRVDIWGLIWPLFIVGAGLTFFVGMLAGGRALGALAIPGSIITMIGLILLVQNTFGVWATWAYAWALIIVAVGIGMYIFHRYSNIPELGQVGRIIIIIGFVLFFLFGTFFELGAALFGMRSLGGVFWAVALILLGVYFLVGRPLIGRSFGPVERSTVTFHPQPAKEDIAPVGAPAEASAVAGDPVHVPGGEESGGARVYSAESPASMPPAQVSGVRRVRFRSVGDLTILQGEREGLEIEAPKNIKDRIRTQVQGDTLEISFAQDWWSWLDPGNWTVGPIRYTLTVADLEYLDASGVGNTLLPDLSARRLELIHSGAGNVTARKVAAEELVVRQSGVGQIEVEGRVERQEVELPGAGSYRAGRLESRAARVRLSGVGSASVWVTEELDARVSGTGSIEYRGSPRLSQSVSGVGSVRQVG